MEKSECRKRWEADQKRKSVDVIRSTIEYTEGFKVDFKLFNEHSARAKEQFEQLRHLKLDLPSSHVIAQMDFSQNYPYQAVEEIQSAYWDQSEQVTLHPVVFFITSEMTKSCITEVQS